MAGVLQGCHCSFTRAYAFIYLVFILLIFSLYCHCTSTFSLLAQKSIPNGLLLFIIFNRIRLHPDSRIWCLDNSTHIRICIRKCPTVSILHAYVLVRKKNVALLLLFVGAFVQILFHETLMYSRYWHLCSTNNLFQLTNCCVDYNDDVEEQLHTNLSFLLI